MILELALIGLSQRWHLHSHTLHGDTCVSPPFLRSSRWGRRRQQPHLLGDKGRSEPSNQGREKEDNIWLRLQTVGALKDASKGRENLGKASPQLHLSSLVPSTFQVKCS